MSRSVNVNFRMDADLKAEMEKVCSDMGMSMTTAFTIFAKTVTREKRIPFEVSAEPFCSDSNISYLEDVVQDAKDGKSNFAEHELIEEEIRDDQH